VGLGHILRGEITNVAGGMVWGKPPWGGGAGFFGQNRLKKSAPRPFPKV